MSPVVPRVLFVGGVGDVRNSDLLFVYFIFIHLFNGSVVYT